MRASRPVFRLLPVKVAYRREFEVPPVYTGQDPAGDGIPKPQLLPGLEDAKTARKRLFSAAPKSLAILARPLYNESTKPKELSYISRLFSQGISNTVRQRSHIHIYMNLCQSSSISNRS